LKSRGAGLVSFHGILSPRKTWHIAGMNLPPESTPVPGPTNRLAVLPSTVGGRRAGIERYKEVKTELECRCASLEASRRPRTF